MTPHGETAGRTTGVSVSLLVPEARPWAATVRERDAAQHR
ncbi:hypothetical protein SBA2_630031 [Acidobacteriia bacterium SbA2]|nr:hypothetical protein SBA2_630031 [Acidobacteriia bacterium SbA2]